jgi:hypothetical protein
MKTVKVLCAMLVLGSSACELRAAEADSGARNAEATHDAGSTGHDGARQEQVPAPARDSRGTEQRSASDSGAQHDRAPATSRDSAATDQRSASGTGTRHDPTPAPAKDGGRPDRRSAAAGSTARTGRSEGRPRQVVQSRGRTVRPNSVRAPQADSRIAGDAGPPRVSSSRGPAATANVARNQGALPGFHAPGRPVRSVPTVAMAAAAGGLHAHAPASVGGPAPAKIASSGTINGTTATPRRRF